MGDVRPYLVPDEGRVTFDPWRLDDADGDEGTPLTEDYEGWDTATTLHLIRTVRVGLADLRADTHLPADVPLRLAASWNSSTSGMGGTGGMVMDVHDGQIVLRARLLGHLVGGTLSLRTTLCVGRSWDGPPGTARYAGSVLASDEFRLALEGHATLFPIEVVDFPTTRLHPKASWHLTLQPEMEKPFLGACWLSLNARDNELIEAVSAKRRNPRQEAIIAEMHHGVAQMLIEAAELADQAFDLASNDWPADSVGDVLSRYMRASADDVGRGAVTLESLTERRTLRAGRARLMGFGRTIR